MKQLETTKSKCVWSYQEENVFATCCGQMYVIHPDCDGSLSEQSIKYCPFCGGEIDER